MGRWHKFWHPHCQRCIDAARESKVCPSCEVLKVQLEREQAEKKLLLQRLLAPVLGPVERSNEDIPLPITPRHVPFGITRAKLESEDRAKAAELSRVAREAEINKTEDLEKELGVESG